MIGPPPRAAAVTDAFDDNLDLDTVRMLLAIHDASVTLSPFATALHEAGLAVDRATADAPLRDYVTAARHDLPFDVPVNLGLPITTAPAIRPTRRSGPFTGLTGQFWLWLFGPAQAEQVWTPSGSRPALVLTAARLPRFGGQRYVVELAAGTVWVQASALGPGLPDDAYVGFVVSAGTLALDPAPTITAGRLTTAGPLQATLQATLSPDTAIVGDMCPASASVDGPGTVEIAWTPTGTTISLGPASVSFGGSSIALDPYVGPPAPDAELDVVMFGSTLTPATWDASTLSGPAATFTGRTGISGGWSLPLVRPDATGHLGEASTPGVFVFTCADPLRVQWSGSARQVELDATRVVVRAGQVILSSRHGSAVEQFSMTMRLWATRPDDGAPRLPLTLRFGKSMVFAYLCDAAKGVGLYATCAADVTLDRPVTITGGPTDFPGADLALMSVRRMPGGSTVQVLALARTPPEGGELLALRNALVAVTPPPLLMVTGQLGAAGNIDSGALVMPFGASGWTPTLPDPYVTNHRGVDIGGRSASAAMLVATVAWAMPPAPELTFSGTLPMPGATDAPVTPDPTRPVRQSADQIRVPTQTAQGSLLAHMYRHVNATEVPTQTAPVGPLAEAGATRATLSEQSRGVRLLDVSTRKDLLGVELLGTGRGGGFAVQGLDVCTPAAALHVITLPQVQWEPVRTLDQDQDVPHLGFFPTPLASVTDGGATALSVQSVRLVPAIPDLAVNAVLAEFGAGESARLTTTLPFGLRARLELRGSPSADGRAADTVARNEPEFAQLRGGAQLAFTAESGPSGRDDSSYFDGAAIQLRNGVVLETGAPLNISVLGSVLDPTDSVQEMFNNEFAPGAPHPRVPVTRLDISGYGGSTFSDWIHRSAAYAEAAKVQFQVVVGRTALEVVKFATVLYPWGIRLTRTVTIERRGGGGVVRRDSGWQASSPGLFQFPAPASYTVHPGLLRGLFGVRDIRPTGMAPITFTGRNGMTVTLVPKFFDARARLDGVTGDGELDAVGVLGYLQVEPVGQPLHEDDVRALLLQQGAVGGPVDGLLNVGNSGFQVRVTRIEVDTALDSGGRPELVAAVRTAPVFRQNGAWSAVRMPGPGNTHGDAEAVNVGDVRGLPVVREGQLTGVVADIMQIGPQTDYRFADPADVHRPNDPFYEYGFLQTSAAHVFVFPRPYVDPGVPELRSRTEPRFADPYARGTSKGLFPPAVNAITLPANALSVDPTGAFRLRDDVIMNAPRGALILGQQGADVLQVDYAGSRLALSITPTAWRLDMPGVEVWTDCLGISKVAGMRTHFIAGTNDRPIVTEIASLLQHDIETALTFLAGFGDRPMMGPIDLGTSNTVKEHKFSVQVDHEWSFPPGEHKGPGIKLAIGGKGEYGWSKDNAPPPGDPPGTTFEVGLAATGEVEGKIPLGGVFFLLLGAEIEIGGALEIKPMMPDKVKFQFDLKAYVGVGIETGIFEGSLVIGYHLAIDGGQIKNGIFGKLSAEIDLKIIKVGVEGEFGGLWYADVSHPPNQHAADVAGEVQVNVDLLFIAIHASYEYQSTSYVG